MSTSTPQKQRLLSLDTLRGFDMFWITGGDQLIHALAAATGSGFFIAFSKQMEHPDWDGFTAYDLIFPLFIFLAGVSTPFSLGSRLAKGTSKTHLLKKVIQRGAILVILGIIYNDGLFKTTLEGTRYVSVLGRIGLAGMGAQIIYLYFNQRQIYFWTAGLLIGYWLIMAYYPVPGCGAGHLTIDCNPATYVDVHFLPGRLRFGNHDPLGLLSTMSAIPAGLFGIIAGEIIRNQDAENTENRKVLVLGVVGILLILVGLIWSLHFPLNKNIWSSSYATLCGGISFLLLALFYWVIDVLHYRKWTFFFVVIGMNSIVIYLAPKFIKFSYTSDALFGGLIGHFPDSTQGVLKVLALIAVQWVFLYVLYRKKWFLKI